jgi:hypothetical protein
LTQQDLDRLLEVLALEDGAHSELSSHVIDDYIHGRARIEDQDLVETAMARSGAVREEVLALATIAKRGREFAALEAPCAPLRRGRLGPVVSLRKSAPWRPRRSHVMAFCGLFAVAVAVWLFTPIPPRPFTRAPALYTVSFDRTLTDEQFETGIQRTPEREPAFPEPRNVRDAALMSFFQTIEWRDGDFLIHPVLPQVGGEREYRLLFELERDGETATWPYGVSLPRDAEEPQTAILVFPDLDLHWVDSNAWKGRVLFRQDAEQRLFLTVAYRVGDQHRASAPTMIPPP